MYVTCRIVLCAYAHGVKSDISQVRNFAWHRSIGFCYLNTNGFLKNTSTAYARTTRSTVPKLFWAHPKSEFGEHLVIKFVFNISDLHFSHVPTLQKDTSNRLAVVTLKIHNSGLDRVGMTFFWPFATLVWVSTHTLGTTGLDKLNNGCVNCGENYLLTSEQSHGDNRLCLRFRKYLTVFTLCVVKHMQVCLENMCNFHQFTILSLSYL